MEKVRKSKANWGSRYAGALAISDLVVVSWAVAGAHFLRFGWENSSVSVVDRFFAPSLELNYGLVSAVIVAAWWLALTLVDARDPGILGVGAEEYKRIATASFGLFGALAIVAYLTMASVGRGYVAIAFPAGLIGLMLSRAAWREVLRLRRSAGKSCTRTVVAGSVPNVVTLVKELQRQSLAGYRVVGACVPAHEDTAELERLGVDVLGDVDDAVLALSKSDAAALMVTACSSMSPHQLRSWGWELSGTGVDVVVAPSLVDVAGPRIHMRPVSGLPLLHVEGPRLPRTGAIVKGTFDRFVAAWILLAISPLLAATALAVALTSRGPVFYSQERIGEDGEPFTMWKFRSMYPDADSKLAQLLKEQGKENDPLFKPDPDPRITPVGRFIRKYSIDELPQLWNVLVGDMSLVGPRPQRQAEVDLYPGGAERRLLCKPGLTGLWQVSGRSNLAWDEAIRLDLYYVENWSFTLDLLLLWRTSGVVLAGEGAR